MRYRFAPQDFINLQMKQMVYLGDNQWEVKEDADPELARTFAEDEQLHDYSRPSGQAALFRS